MKSHSRVIVLFAGSAVMLACASQPGSDRAAPAAQDAADANLAAFIERIRAVDNHSHANSVAPDDADADALPLDGIAPFELPAPVRPESPLWLAAFKALYNYPHADLSDAHRSELRGTMQGIAKAQGDSFPTWVLDQVGTEVLLANRIALGPGLAPPRFRWVPFADALLFPLSNRTEAATTPDREKLFPLEDKLLQRYLSDRHLAKLPSSLDEYLKAVVSATLEAQRAAGAVAVKFEAAYLRSLDFAQVPAAIATVVYAKYVGGGEPSPVEYKALQDFLFRYIAREAGRLGMAVHVHSFEGAGNYFETSGADPLLLEPVFNDPALRKTSFVLIHGGGVYAAHSTAMLWKPNVYVDTSLLTLVYPPPRLAGMLREWLSAFPERVLFGSDASAFGPEMGWDTAAWIASRNGRAALAMALSGMLRDGEISRVRAEELATMVMRTNAGRLYGLDLK